MTRTADNLLSRALITASIVVIAAAGLALHNASQTSAAAGAGAPAAGPSPTVLWQAGSPGLDNWVSARDGQCGGPVAAGTRFTFSLAQQGTNCIRNQVQPIDSSGDSFRLTDGHQYTWTFHYIDGGPGGGPGMGYDADARSLIFQVHPYGGGNPCVGLAFFNGGTIGSPQQWLLTNCSGNVWNGAYAPGEEDDWKLVMLVSQKADGNLKLYRNGTLVANASGPTYSNKHGGKGDPWWNFGPYKWRWQLAGGGNSTTNHVNATIDNMTLTTP